MQAQFGIPVAAIVRLQHLVAYLGEQQDAGEHLRAIAAYRGRYGVDS